MNRRDAIKTLAITGTATVIAGASMVMPDKKRHFVTLSFDDGFKKSSIKTAEIFEKYGLRACINVIAGRPGSEKFLPPDEWHRHPAGDWKLWNELKTRGHEIMPHGLVHADLTSISLRAAQNMIIISLDIFCDKLEGFDPSKSVFNFPYNRSTPELENWLKTIVMAFRTGGEAINPVPYKGQYRLTCTTGGEWNIDMHLNQEVDKLLQLPQGWLIYNTHGIDEEGWGPVSAGALDQLLARLKEIDTVQVVSAAEIINQINH